ncbi:sensor histidine kinase [Fulvimonas sp. R45]|uniref:sensor histidine kinase n=1 Tax=Fulvimonas sp. R45 TaxID=3045937 RepID=UPI00265E38A4|nr:sensor histidine kinase [Fulvimonas sp. R45]MDO1529939.1 sensor histidine kinase [Fulvimonas sp. R45]
MSWTNFSHIRLLRYTGLFTCVCVSLPLLQVLPSSWGIRVGVRSPAMCIASNAIFALTYLALTSREGMTAQGGRGQLVRLLGLIVLTGSAIVMGWASRSGLSAMLMVVISVALPWQLPTLAGLLWMLGQNLLLTPLISSYMGWTIPAAFLQVCMYLGMSALAFFTSLVARQQLEEREAQRRLNSELRATRALLAESTRIAERMRIARELHDLIGHHLTALSLNLEVASHLVNPDAADHVRKAQATAKHLLSDVREAVSELRQDDAVDLTQALRSLVEGVPGLAVHVTTPPRFGVEDPRRAQVLLRCAQEIITNAARHANARNLWLHFAYAEDNLLGLHARDDGRGASSVAPGNGLSGMRERLAEFGGSVTVESEAGRGFELTVRLPLGETPALAHAPARFEPPALSVG